MGVHHVDYTGTRVKNLSRRVEEVGVRLRMSEMSNNKLASLPDRAEPPCAFFSARFIDCTSIPSRELRFFGVYTEVIVPA